MIVTPEDITSRKRLTLNVIWNLLGFGAPLLFAVIAIPLLIEGMGTARFGVLTLAWVVVGYFSLFDLGLGRALTKLVAEKLGKGQEKELPALIWTAMSLMMILGMIGAIVVAVLSPWLVGSVTKVPEELQAETLIAFYLLAISIPVVIVSTGLRGILEAHQRFGLVNVVRLLLGTSNFLGPLALLPFTNSLVPIVALLVLSRLISCCIYVSFSLRIVPVLRQSVQLKRAIIRPLISFGGWMTVTNLVGPLMTYLDRFFIGATVSMVAVAYYATPYEIVTKLGIVSGALMGVVFPAFSTAFAQDIVRVTVLFKRAVNYIFISLFPVVLIIVVLSSEGMTLWLGREFSDNSSVVLQLLAVGVFINSHAQVPFALVQGAGRPDLTAKLHLLELPFFLLFLWWLLSVYGIIGAAIAWVMRTIIDALLLFFIARQLLPSVSTFSLRPMLVSGLVSVSVFILGSMLAGFAVKLLFLLIVLSLFLVHTWLFVFGANEKNMIQNQLKKIRYMRIK